MIKEYIKKARIANPCEVQIDVLSTIHNSFSTPGHEESSIVLAHKMPDLANENSLVFKTLGAFSGKDSSQILVPKSDTYFTLNDFYLPKNANIVDEKLNLKFTKRSEKTLRNLNAMWVDLDYYKSEYSGYPFELIIEEIRMSENIPHWNIQVNSGRGAYLVWLLNPVENENRVGAFENEIKKWKEIQEQLIKTLAKYGADFNAKGPAGVLRFPNSINSKSNSIVEYNIIDSEPYSLNELANSLSISEVQSKEYWKGNITFPQKKVLVDYKKYNLKYEIPKDLHLQKGSYIANYIENVLSNISHLKGDFSNKIEKGSFKTSIANLYESRRMDLLKLLELRKFDIKSNSILISREVFLWLYSNCFVGESIDLTESIYKINSKMNNPLPESELKQIVSQRKKQFYSNISNKYFIKQLCISKSEMRHMRVLISNKEKARRKLSREKRNRRGEDGLTNRERSAKENYNTFLNAYEALSHLSIRQIADFLNLGKSTIHRYLVKYLESLSKSVPQNTSFNWGVLELLTEKYSVPVKSLINLLFEYFEYYSDWHIKRFVQFFIEVYLK